MTNDLVKILDRFLDERPREKSYELVTAPSKFAPVAPSRFYTAMRELGYIPQQVLLLAHDVVKDPRGYAEFQRPEWSNTKVFMDNSLVELKNAVDADMVHEAAEATNADIVILPDVMGDGEASTKATLDAWEHWYWRFRDYDKLVVIHGSNLKQWLSSAETLAQLQPDWISIPRVTEDVIGVAEGVHREDLVLFAHAIYPNTPIHLLGFSNYPWWDLRAAAMHYVKSIDSAVPLRQSSLNIFSDDPGPRGDWWDSASWNEDAAVRCQNVDRVISILRL